ncbi:MAG: hypothetical protein LHV68_04270 [Elusimicrobia bacterium]|nr:hypothetical protein [Candidatus Liberimonas magnetica]
MQYNSNLRYKKTEVCQEDPAPYFAHRPGYYDWEISRPIDRFLYVEFEKGKALVVFGDYPKYMALLGDCGYVLIWLKGNEPMGKGYSID